MIQVVKYPAGIAFARNEMKFQFKGDLVSTIGKNYSVIFAFNLANEPNAAGNWVLNYGENTISFQLVALPDDSGMQLPYYDAANYASTADWQQDFFNKLMSNNLLMTDFDFYFIKNVTAYTWGIKLQAKERGTAFNLSSNTTFGSMLKQNEVLGVNDSIKDNYMMLLRVLVEQENGSNIFELIDTQELYFNANGMTETDLSSLMRTQLKYKAPEWNQNFVSAIPDVLKRYKIQWIEVYGTPIVKNSIQEFNHILMAINGAVKYEEIQLIQNLQAIATEQDLFRDFLTYQPDNKRVLPEQQEFLYFLLNDNDFIFVDSNTTDYGLTVKAYDANGAVVVNEQRILLFYDLVQKNGICVICIPVGLKVIAEQLADATLMESVVKYEVWITTNDDSFMSNKRTYYVDHSVYRNKLEMLVGNALGGIDTIMLKGADELQNKSVKSESRGNFDKDYNSLSEGQNTSWEIEYMRAHNASTGYLDSQDWMLWLNEFVNSNFHAVSYNPTQQGWNAGYAIPVTQSMGEWVRVMLSDTEHTLGNLRDFIPKLKFGYKIAYNDTGWSNGKMLPQKKRFTVLFQAGLDITILAGALRLKDNCLALCSNYSEIVERRISKIWKLTANGIYIDFSHFGGYLSEGAFVSIAAIPDGQYFTEYVVKNVKGDESISRGIIKIQGGVINMGMIAALPYSVVAADNMEDLMLSIDYCLRPGFAINLTNNAIRLHIAEGKFFDEKILADKATILSAIGSSAWIDVDIRYRKPNFWMRTYFKDEVHFYALPNDEYIFSNALIGKE